MPILTQESYSDEMKRIAEMLPGEEAWLRSALAAAVKTERENPDPTTPQYLNLVMQVGARAGLILPPGGPTRWSWMHASMLSASTTGPRSLDHILLPHMARHLAIRTFGFAIPTAYTLAEIAKLGPIVEIGAGGGYWGFLLRRLGVDILCYDKYPNLREVPDRLGGPSGARWTWDEKWIAVEQGGPEKVLGQGHRTLLLGWPPWDDMAYECLRQYEGNVVIWIGDGGCTGNDEFYKLLERDFVESAEYQLPNWDGINDWIRVWRRNK